MRKLLRFAVPLLLVASGCRGASSSTETLPAGQLDPMPPEDVSPPTGFAKPPSRPPPEEVGEYPGCPSTRDDAQVDLVDAAEVAARLPGMYRTCFGTTGIELRADPESATRLVWYALDERFVRAPGIVGTTGVIDIGDCDGSTCTVVWSVNGTTTQPGEGVNTMTVWREPIAIGMDSEDGARTEWVRVAR